MPFRARALAHPARYALAAVAAAALAPATASASHGLTLPVSLTPAGITGNDSSTYPDMTPDGRFVAFASSASDLVPGDTNGVGDVFVRDRRTGVTERVSVGAKGAQGDGDSNVLGIATNVAISDDGRYVAFKSEATNLARGDRNGLTDVFVRDRAAGTTERVSLDDAENDAGGGDEPAISADGRYVAFTTAGIDDDFSTDVYLRDRVAGTTRRISVAADGGPASNTSSTPAIGLAPGGPVVAFSSAADNLVPDDDDGRTDVFVRDLSGPAPATERVSVAADGGDGTGIFGARSPSISADGRLVAFSSDATNLTATPQSGPSRDIFVRDRSADVTTLETPGAGGAESDDNSEGPDLGPDGRFLSFSSFAGNLGATPGESDGSLMDGFVRDRTTGSVALVSVGSDDAAANQHANAGPVSQDGQVTLFTTNAEGLSAADTNLAHDVFAFDRRPAADLALAKADAPDPVAPRGTLTYTLQATNVGANPAPAARIVDTLPASVTFESASAGCTHAAGTVDCALGTLAAGDTRTVTITVTPRKTGTITNTARVGSDAPDPDPANDTATATTTVAR